MYATASAKPIPIPHNQKSKSMSARSRARGHSIAQTTAAAATKPASPSHRSQSPMMAQTQQHSASTSAPSSAAIFSTSSPSVSTRAGPSSTASKKLAGNKLSSSAVSSSSAASSPDLNIREFFPEGDAALLKFMDGASIIKAQKEALEALNDAAFVRALRESEETAAKEEMKRKGKGKERADETTMKEKELPRAPMKEDAVKDQVKEKERVEAEAVIAKEDAISSTESRPGIPLPGSDGDTSQEIKVSKEVIAPVPVAHSVTKSGEGEARGHQQEAPRSSTHTPGPSPASLSSKEQSSTNIMTVPPPAPLNVYLFERYSEDEAAARLLAREWKVASLQGALLLNPDMAPPSPTLHQIPVSATSSTSSSSSVFFSPVSSANTSMTSVSSAVSSMSSSASAAARKTTVAATTTTASTSPAANRVMPVTIPAETFYSRSSRHKRGDSDSSSSSASSSNTVFSSSRPSTAATSPGPSSQKSSPPTPYLTPTSPTKERPNTSRSGLSYTSASLAAAAQAHAQAQAQAAAKSTSASTSVSESVKTRSGPITSTTSTSTTSTSTTTTAYNSTIRVHGMSRHVPAVASHRRSISSSSPERPRTAPSPAVTPTKVQKVHTSTLASPLSPSRMGTTMSSTKNNSSVLSSSTNAAGAATGATAANVTVISKGVISSPTSQASTSSEKSRSSSVSSSPGISPSTSATSSSSVNSTSTSVTSVSTSSSVNVVTSPTASGPVIVTSASKVAAEKEREKRAAAATAAAITSKLSAPSSSASAAAKRASMSTTTVARPTPNLVNTAGASGDHHSRERSNTERDRNEVAGLGSQGLSSLSSIPVSSSPSATTTLPSPILRGTKGLEPINTPSSSSHQKKTSTSTTTTTTSASTSASTAAVKSSSASSSASSTPQRPLSPHTTTSVRPRDAEELFSVPLIAPGGVLGGVGSGGLGVGGTSGVGGQQQQVGGGVVGAAKAVVPVSELLESDDEDDGVEEEEEDAEDEEDEEENSDNEEEGEVNEEVEVVEADEVVSFFDVYTADRSCSKCGESIVYSPYNPKKSSSASSFTLHISCPHCSTLHCRGCVSPATKCPKNCTGSGNDPACGIINDCCPQVRAIAIFEALSAFDKAYLAEVNGGRKAGSAEREEFIRDLISKPVGPQARGLEPVFVRCMNLLVEVFTSSSLSSEFLSSTFASHFEHSLMPEVIHLYLENTNVKVWITHSDVYSAILDLLRYMFEAGFGESVMDVKLRRVGETKGLGEWLMVDEETMKWVMRIKDEKVVEGGEMSRGLLKGGAERIVDTPSPRKGETSLSAVVIEMDDKEEYAATMEPLKSLIMGLETHRTSLLEVSNKVTFMPTVEKLNVLCDGISHLVLLQVLGILSF